ncbi:hypothetical protein SeMB42_g00924 [Synchytrium endobioticum]|uniref:Uncharacterized protein n=1 Tax=Synchytrium endobioticum TaxID=286115 RepID=A0A507DNX4_9FUNG|nr:hypothetical protein SeMB42_g00924 [Synchytrium endobioticum]
MSDGTSLVPHADIQIATIDGILGTSSTRRISTWSSSSHELVPFSPSRISDNRSSGCHRRGIAKVLRAPLLRKLAS